MTAESGEYEKLKALGNLALENKDFESARKYFEEAIALEPENPEGYKHLGDLYKEFGATDKAEELYLKAIDINPQYWNAYINLGNLYRSRKNYEEAIEWGEKARAISSDNPVILGNLANYYNGHGQLDKAESCYIRAIELDNSPYVQLNYAILLREQGRFEEAIPLLEALVNDTDDEIIFRAHENLALLYSDYPTPISESIAKKLVYHLESLLELNLQKFEAKKISLEFLSYIYLQIGFGYYYSHDYEKAIEHLQKSLEFDPFKNLENVYHNLAKAYAQLGRWAESEISYKKYSELMEMDLVDTLDYATVLYQQAKYSEVIQLIEPLLPSIPLVLKGRFTYRLASAFYKVKQIKESLTYYQMYQQLAPKDWKGYKMLATIYAKEGSKQKAIDAINSAIDLGYTDSELMDLLLKLSPNEEKGSLD